MGWLGRMLGRPLRRRAYDGAAVGRRTAGWQAPGSSANTEVQIAATRLRDRSRELVRNNPHAAKAVAVLVNNIVGPGIMPRAATGIGRLDRTIDAAWEAWSAQCDAEGGLDLYGLQSLACRAMVESGEALIRRRPRRLSDGLTVPLQLQVMEPDLLDAGRNETLKSGHILQGIEFDRLGRRRAYWLLSAHPGESLPMLSGRSAAKPVPARDIAHLYERQRPGQVRGIPWLAPVIRKLRDLDDYDEAEIMRKKIEACVTAIVFGAEEGEDGIAPAVVDADGRRVESFEPGLIAYARGGKDIRFNEPASVGGYAEYRRANLHTIAAGARITYELLTGDLSQVNYSSIRAGLVEFRRLMVWTAP